MRTEIQNSNSGTDSASEPPAEPEKTPAEAQDEEKRETSFEEEIRAKLCSEKKEDRVAAVQQLVKFCLGHDACVKQGVLSKKDHELYLGLSEGAVSRAKSGKYNSCTPKTGRAVADRVPKVLRELESYERPPEIPKIIWGKDGTNFIAKFVDGANNKATSEKSAIPDGGFTINNLTEVQISGLLDGLKKLNSDSYGSLTLKQVKIKLMNLWARDVSFNPNAKKNVRNKRSRVCAVEEGESDEDKVTEMPAKKKAPSAAAAAASGSLTAEKKK